MEKFTKVLKFGDNVIPPLLIILLDEVPLPLIVELLHEATILDVPQHMKVCLTLHLLVVPHTIEETLRPVLDFHEGSTPILVHLKSIDAPHNLVQSPLNRTDVMGVECVILDQLGLVRISRLVLVPSPVVRVEGLAEVVFSNDHILC